MIYRALKCIFRCTHLATKNFFTSVPAIIAPRKTRLSYGNCLLLKNSQASIFGHSSIIVDVFFTIQEAAEKALDKMKDRVGAVSGVIAIDQTGNFGKAFSTRRGNCATKKNDNLQFHLYTA